MWNIHNIYRLIYLYKTGGMKCPSSDRRRTQLLIRYHAWSPKLTNVLCCFRQTMFKSSIFPWIYTLYDRLISLKWWTLTTAVDLEDAFQGLISSSHLFLESVCHFKLVAHNRCLRGALTFRLFHNRLEEAITLWIRYFRLGKKKNWWNKPKRKLAMSS